VGAMCHHLTQCQLYYVDLEGEEVRESGGSGVSKCSGGRSSRDPKTRASE
jgi:hypothetical protein